MTKKHHRRSIRMKGYDYAQEGAYLVTICTYQKLELFGQIPDGSMHPSALGNVAYQCWHQIPEHMPQIKLGPFVLMPNHVHGIVIIAYRNDGIPLAQRNVGARYIAPLPVDTNESPIGTPAASTNFNLRVMPGLTRHHTSS